MNNQMSDGEAAYLMDSSVIQVDDMPDDEYLRLQQVGIAYVIAVLGEPPEGTRLDAIWATGPGGEPWIAVAHIFPSDRAADREYSMMAEYLLGHFSDLVKWEDLTRVAVAELIQKAKEASQKHVQFWEEFLKEAAEYTAAKEKLKKQIVIRREVSDEILFEVYAQNLVGQNLQNRNLRQANLVSMYLDKVDFSGADLSEANLSAANLLETALSRAVLTRALLNYADFYKVAAKGADFGKCSCAHVFVRESNFDEANFEDANLNGARVTSCNFVRANLDNIVATHAQFESCKLSEATLRHADLSGSSLSGSSFEGADLEGANLTGTDLRRTNLRTARLVGTKLSGAIYDNGTQWPEDFDPSEAGVVWTPQVTWERPK